MPDGLYAITIWHFLLTTAHSFCTSFMKPFSHVFSRHHVLFTHHACKITKFLSFLQTFTSLAMGINGYFVNSLYRAIPFTVSRYFCLG